MDITFKYITDKIIHLDFSTQEEMCSALLRFEEHGESPEFKGKIFSLDQYKEWYTKEYGGWTYYGDWNGFNIPSNSFVPFRKGLFDPLSETEKQVLSLIPEDGIFCVIGTYKTNANYVFSHELLHGFYFTDLEYRKKVNEILKGEDMSFMFEALKALGYDESAWIDESHAYIATGFGKRLPEKGGKVSRRLVEKLSALTDSYLKGFINLDEDIKSRNYVFLD
jgi:hypothetical protein